jgi:beta-xylosidase
MTDYHVFSLPTLPGPVTDHGAVLTASSVPWVSKQMWAPDAAFKNGKYYLFFPARDHAGVFRIGVAVGSQPEGPFAPEAEPIKGSYSIDPACFVDDDGEAYLYFGGIWGGQLQCWATGEFKEEQYEVEGEKEPKTGAALLPRVARMADDMLSFKSEVLEVRIVDAVGELLAAEDHDRRFFEAAWLHKYDGTYYFSYSTGDTHFLAYATSTSPLGPFTYRGKILDPVLGWTTHHSIVEFQNRWWLFYHDCSLSGGKNHLRSVKVKEIFYDKEGNIKLSA